MIFIGRCIELGFVVVVVIMLSCSGRAESRCSKGCDAVASYYVRDGNNLTFISEIFNTEIERVQTFNQIKEPASILASIRMNIPFRCDCFNKQFLGHIFQYRVRSGNTYSQVATLFYSNLTTQDWLQNSNNYNGTADQNAYLNVTVNCSCGDPSVSKDYGLFLTYPLRPGESLSSLATNFNLSHQLIQQYNPTTDFDSGTGLLYIPIKDEFGNYRALKLSKAGISIGAIAGLPVAGIVAALFMAVCIYVGISRKKKMKALLLQEMSDNYNQHRRGDGIPLNMDSADVQIGASPRLTGITVDKSMEFSYEELAQATGDFCLANKIGQGGFGAVYYAELRGEKAAIKKMDLQASKEFLAELKILTNVHHLNLVRLIGYCVEGSLFIVYEFIENGNLSEHLRGSGKEPLQWPTRVQIALDSARGLEYIHEHTVPVYIHRDIKSANILIDKNFHGKVADFGLVKLTEVGSSVHTQLAGTFGYMPPECAYGKISPKVDVFAFGVVLYELISAKEAVEKESGSSAHSKGLVALFDEALSHPDTREEFHKLVDPTLGDNYPFESIHKMALLAKACTHKNAKLRPSMRSVVVALMTLSSSTDDWDVGSFYENQALMKLMSGRYLYTRLFGR